MSKVDFNFTLSLDDSEFIKVDDHLYTTQQLIKREEPMIHIIGTSCLQTLKPFEGQLTYGIIQEWLLLSRALDQTCNYENKWDDEKILRELIAGNEHPVSWYAKYCTIPETVIH